MSLSTNNAFTRYIFLIILACSTAGAVRAQNILNNAGLTVSSAAAYSTRQLSTAYTGPAIRVRRSSDNKEADIAFDGTGNISASSIATMVVGGATSPFSTFYAATSCFISIWYDQSGNGRNCTQAALASQPSVVNAGVPYTFNGKQAVFFNGGSSVMTVPFAAAVINAQGSFSTVVAQPALQINFPALIAWGGASPFGPGFGPLDVTGKFGLYTTTGPTNVTLGPIAPNTNYVLNATWNGTAVTESRNKTVTTGVLGNAFSASLSSGLLGQDNPSSSFFNGTVPELIVFSTALTTLNRQALENNQTTAFLTPATGLSFDGVDDYVACGNILTPSYTKEAWINISNTTLPNNIISGGDLDGIHAFWAPAIYGNRLSAGHNGVWNQVQDPTPLLAGTWYHVAVTYDAASTTLRLYKNGVLVSSNTAVPGFTTGNTVRIGAYNNATNQFGGNIDEARIWSRALAQNEIQNNMSCELNATGQTGLLALYHLNQGNLNADNTSITTATDASSNSNTGTLNNFALTGSSSNWAAGNATGSCAAPAGGLSFDGVNDNVNCGSAAGITNLGKNGFTLETWINLSNTNNINSIIRKTGDYNMYVLNGNVHVEYWTGGVGNPSFQHMTGTIAIANNTWTHIAATWNGSSTAALYVNGVLNNGASNSSSFSGSENLTLGQSPIFAQPMAGSLDELRIWNRALCQSEIQNNMNCILNPAGQTGLQALYHFDQGFVNAANSTLTTLNDQSGNNNNGTLVNFGLTGSSSNWTAGTVTTNCTAFAPAVLAGTAGGIQVCQSTTVQAPGTFYLDAGCNLIANLSPSGASPLTGSITSCVKIDASVQLYRGQHYVQRHYDITPATNPATATGTITLYYTQAEFNAYNAVRGGAPALPTGAADATGIANVRITQFHGTGTAPGNYTGATVLINPVDSKIVYNSTLSRWEVTFDVNGFSGFYLHTSGSNAALPIDLVAFSGRSQGSSNLLQWTTATEQNSSLFELQRSADGLVFVTAGTVAAAGNRSTDTHYSYTDDIATSLQPVYYYRLKLIDRDGQITYSNTIRISGNANNRASLYPNPATTTIRVQFDDAGLLNTKAIITDIQGKTVQQVTLGNYGQSVNITALAKGMYLLQLNNGSTLKFTKN